MLARARTPARVRAAARRETTVATAKTLAKARAVARPTVRRSPSNTEKSGVTRSRAEDLASSPPWLAITRELPSLAGAALAGLFAGTGAAVSATTAFSE